MKVKLAYNNELNLPKFKTFQERVDFILEHIFNNQDILDDVTGITYEKYYNINSVNMTEEQHKNLRKRWIGVKPVNLPYPDESIKKTIDYLTGYLLSGEDYSAKHDIHRFKELMRRQHSKREKDKLNAQKKIELENLTKNVIYYKIRPQRSSKNSFVFYENKTYERFMKNRLNEINQIINIIIKINSKCQLDNNEKYIYELNTYPIGDLLNIKIRLENNIALCKEIKKKVKCKIKQILELKQQIKQLEMEIKNNYKILKEDRKNENLFKKIVNDTKIIRKIKSDIEFLELEIEELTDDYLQITELYIKQV